jgi:hypothetical protein
MSMITTRRTPSLQSSDILHSFKNDHQSFTFSPQGDFVIDVKFTFDGAVSDEGVTCKSHQHKINKV